MGEYSIATVIVVLEKLTLLYEVYCSLLRPHHLPLLIMKFMLSRLISVDSHTSSKMIFSKFNEMQRSGLVGLN